MRGVCISVGSSLRIVCTVGRLSFRGKDCRFSSPRNASYHGFRFDPCLMIARLGIEYYISYLCGVRMYTARFCGLGLWVKSVGGTDVDEFIKVCMAQVRLLRMLLHMYKDSIVIPSNA